MKFGYTISFLIIVGLYLSSEVSGGCVEKPLALREELADVVMTGTVRAMHPDDANPSRQVAEVEAKRVMKGRGIVKALPGKLNRRRRKMVFVEGIGDPKFCESSVRKYDTRIFLLSTMKNGHLRLNSSVVRLTLRTIERTDAAVKSVALPPIRKVIYTKPQDDVPYVPRLPPKQKPCEKLYCAYGAVCVEKDNQAKCKCHQVCGTIFAPVCGDNGVTYTNECRLRLASCNQQKRIKVKHPGNCYKKDPCAEKKCENGARCVPSVDGLSARCQCIEKCYDFGDSVNSRPVCGVNGVDYKNLCELKKTSCLQMKEIKVKYYGKCDPCKDYKCGPSEVCQIKENREPFCSCRGICNSEFAPVCASDGRTYSNECIMNREACKAQRKLHVVMTGECTQGDKTSSTTPPTTTSTTTSENTSSKMKAAATTKAAPYSPFDMWRLLERWKNQDRKKEKTNAKMTTKMPLKENRRKEMPKGKDRGRTEEKMVDKVENVKQVVTETPSDELGASDLEMEQKLGMKPTYKPLEKTTEKPLGKKPKPTRKPKEIPKEPTDRQKPKVKPKPKEKPARKPKEKPARKPKEKPKEKPARKPKEKPKEKPARKPKEKPETKPKEKPETKPKEKPNDKHVKTTPKPTKPTPRPWVRPTRRPKPVQVPKTKPQKQTPKPIRSVPTQLPWWKAFLDLETTSQPTQAPKRKPRPTRKWRPQRPWWGATEAPKTDWEKKKLFTDNIEMITTLAPPMVVKGGDHPCDSVSCGPWEECRIDRQGRAKCACPPPCEPILRQVCGSNEETYDNECELKRAACQSKKTITIKFMGPCGRDSPCSKHNCEYGAKCIVKSGEPACECPTCMEDMSPVCGTDGISYNNECKLRAENCVKRSNTQVKHQGLCNGCENVRCDFFSICQSDENGGGKCVCPESCIQDEYAFYFSTLERPFVDAKVCGSDGATYQNECQLKVTSCRKQKFIMVASYGPCDQCAGIKCPTGARCENGECVCEQFCPERYSPVCGSDGQTYMNECVLKRTACLRNTDIEVKQKGDCDIDGWSGSGDFQSSGTDVCDEESCRFGGVCKNDADAEGTNSCVCNFSCQDESDPSPVCGNDGRIYSSLCSMREASCIKQKDIAVIALSSCKGLDKPCDGNAPLVNARTGLEYDCSTGRDTCPVGTYCHKGLNYAKCCEESMSDSYQVKRCEDRRYGCCPDGKTPAPGPNDAGCPSVCNCNKIGSYSTVCDPVTLQCTCKPGVGDRQCNRCEPGYWGLPLINEGNSGCTPCGCNAFGAVRDDCEQMTGRCVCKPGITGMKCNMCPDGSVLGPGGCNDSPNSCSTLECKYGARCIIKAGMPQCDCEPCKDEDFAPVKVCGTDGQTYGSECQLKTFACRLQRDIAVDYEGPCKMSPFPETTPRPNPRSRKTTRHIGGRKTTRHLTMPTVDPPILTLNGKRFKKQKRPKKAKQMRKNRKSFRPARRMRQRKLKLSRLRQADYRHDVAIIVPQFAGTSYMELRKIPNANMDLTIEMDFRTLNEDGILLYNGNSVDGGGDFLSLAMKDGYLEFRFDLGSGIAVVKSRNKITLKEFHQITAYRAGQTGILKIDDEKDVISTSPGDLRSLNLNEPLYLGYIPELSKGIIEDIGLDVGLVGCIQSLKVFGRDFMKEYNLVYPESLDVQGARGLVECGNNPCNSLPCQNGGLCMTVDETKFKCICEPGYEGDTCADAIDVCKSNPCAKGSSCVNVGDGTYKCKCPFGFSGEHCEKAEPNYQADNFVAEFTGDSYIEYKYNDNAYTKIAFEVWFLTYEDNGVLLYNGQNKDGKGDYLSLNLVNGYLQFKFDLGSGSANIVSADKVSKNEWHKVVIERNKQAGFMDLDDEARVNGRSKGLLQSLNLDQQLYIGGFRTRLGVSIESGVTTGLRGAIQRLYINGRHIENLPKVASDMERISAYFGPPCDNNPCLNSGTCLPVLSQVKCKCPMTHGGKYCETALQDITAVAEVKPIQFDGNTFLQYFNRINRKEIGQKSNHFKLRFKTRAKNGLLLIQHKSPHISGDFVTLTIVHGSVEFGYNLGNQKEFMTIKSPVYVADGKWHTVEVKRQKRKGSIKVDNGETLTSVSGQGATQLDSDGLLWIGGKQNLPTGLPRKYYEPFVGCIKKVEVDNEELNMVKDKQNEVAIIFCDNKYKKY